MKDQLTLEQLQGFFEVALDLLCIADTDGNFIKVNRAWEDILGYRAEDLEERKFLEFVHPDDYDATIAVMSKLERQELVINFTNRYRAKDGSYRYIEWRSHPHGKLIYAAARDITERKTTEDALRESEARTRAMVEAIPDTFYLFSKEGCYRDVQVKDDALLHPAEREAYRAGQLIGQNVGSLLPPEISGLLLETINRVLTGGELQVVEYSLTVNGSKKHFEARMVATNADEVVSIVRDVTATRESEAELKYLSLHDPLTGLYNRAYFEDELVRLEDGRQYPVTIISADLDGLKLINDVLGHKDGDNLLLSCAGVLKESLRSSDVLARVGGDEFAIILPRTGREEGEKVIDRIRHQVEQYNRLYSALPLSISLGLAVAESSLQPLEELYSEADRGMYKDKLQRSRDARDEIVRALLASLFLREGMGEAQNEQVQEFCIKMGQKAKLSENQLADLHLLAQVYDLGKVTVEEGIFYKEGKLTEAEWEEIRQHSEKGYHIAAASSDLSGVADLILRHHENWDGSGYPLGLQGEEIPIECRILAVVDAYNAMVNKRSYGPVLSTLEAIQELDRCAGRQFDPAMVPLLAAVV